VDRLEEYGEVESRVSFTPGPGNMLMEGDTLSAAGLMEHMAQASAVRVGYYCKYILHIPVTIGYIGQIRKFRLYRLPVAGEKLETTIFLRQEIFKISMVDIEVRTGDTLLATASLKTALKDD
jgi:predicted hotdog family 3-hydroxylacyl-ACP dehydratase